jgi:hypothetical protein
LRAGTVHQRGLTGAVLVEQRHGLARAGIEIRGVERKRRAERGA